MNISWAKHRHFITAGVLVLITTIVLNWLLGAALPLPAQASTQAKIIDRLFYQHVFLIAFLFSLVVVFMLYALVVFRKREGDDSEGEHFEGNTSLEIFWTVAPMIFVFIFAYLGITTLNQVTAEQDNELVVKAVGFQWGWRFEYEGGVISPELTLPADRPVLMQLESEDVLHAFWVPAFRVKQDLVPGQTTEIRFTPIKVDDEVDDYTLRCAELCGLSHWKMTVPVHVVDEGDFTVWLDTELAKVSSATANQLDDSRSTD